MVDQYDIFAAVAKEGKVSVKELQEIFIHKSMSSQHIYYHINKLKNKKLVTQKKGIIEIVNSKKSENLYSLVAYCINNNLNYSFYNSKETISFLKKTHNKNFATKDIKINPQQFKELVDTLEKDTFLIRYKKKPFYGRILNHSFIQKLLEYNQIVIKNGNTTNNQLLDDIIISRRRQLRTLIPLNKIGFIHTSLALEGNLLTLKETEKLLKKHIIPKDRTIEQANEVLQYESAINYANKFISSKKSLTKEILLELHKIVMKQKEFAGIVRKDNVTIKGNPKFKTLNFKQINHSLNNFLTEWNTFTSKKPVEIIEKAGYFHNHFQYIHPFEDGNSRTTRLLTYIFFRINGISFYDIPLGFTTEYLSLTKGAKNRNDKKLSNLLKEILIQTIKK